MGIPIPISMGIPWEWEFPFPCTPLIHLSGGTITDVASVIEHWYGEKAHYSPACGRRCGHYTQIVWWYTGHVGCAVNRCGAKTYVVCNYWPKGNYVGHSPYTKGPACSKCGNGAGWCKNKLCNPHCTRAGANCECAVVCYNCAKLDLATCRCKCAKGWYGPYCTKRCEDRRTECGHGWPKSWCKGKHEKHVQGHCPVLCGLCEADPEAKEGACPPARGPGADSAQTMFMKSHRLMMIFLMIAIVFSISSYHTL